jgi:hypothetical protein
VPPDCPIVLWGRRFWLYDPQHGNVLVLGQSHSGVAAGGLGAHAYAGRLVRAFLVALKHNDANGTLVKTMTAGLW